MRENTWNKIDPILDRALDLNREEREAYLQEACGDNRQIYDEVVSLLESIEESNRTHFLEHSVLENKELYQDLTNTSRKQSEDYFIGRQVGSYKIVKQIGHGGMNRVFKAIRTDGSFNQKVAVKFLHSGLQTPKAMNQFDNERQVLANLSHPGIARLFDGGITPEGIPYLIMEYIDGMPIDKYCSKNRLSAEQRLTLFKKIGEAIQYAHNNLIIHRDLKAQNIFVTREGHIKILDFGIAKLLDPSLSIQELVQTLPGNQMWTPNYGAPEQLKGQDVTIATDVYSLGVLLFRLLSDTYPYNFEDRSITEIRTLVGQQPPARLSQAIKDKKSEEKAAQERGLTVKEFKKGLTGDLESIVSKAIKRNPDDRYTSVRHFMDDITNYQNDLPVNAKKNIWQHRFKKFTVRHWAGIVFAIAAVLLIVGFTLFYTV